MQDEMHDEVARINEAMNHPCFSAIRIIKAAERDDTETIYRISEDTDPWHVECWLAKMVVSALQVHRGMTLNEYLDLVAEKQLERMRAVAE